MRLFSVVTLLSSGLSWAGSPEVVDQPMVDLAEHHRHHQHGGITLFVAMAIDTLGTADTRRDAIDALGDTLHSCMEPVTEAEGKLLTTIAEGVRAGAVDPAALKAGIEQLDVAAGTVHACVAGPLNELHAALLPIERAELADKVRAHWAVWRHENHDSELADRKADTRLGAVTKELSLSADQVDKAAVLLKKAFASQTFDVARVQKQVEDFAVAFAKPTFDAKPVTTHSTGTLTAHGVLRMATFYQAVVTVLTAEQRTTLATHLLEHANHHPQVSP